jgi:autonomous glycyl radical cofactor GrcA
MLILPGSRRPRIDENGLPIGGSASNEKNLLARVISFCKSGLVSLKDIASSTAREISVIATDVRVKGGNHKGGL